MGEKIELYRPSTGTEGECFHAAYCHQCEHDRQYRENETEPCDILGRTFIFAEDHPEYPTEWRYVDGKPTCTAFVPSGEAIPEPRCEKTADMFEQEVDCG